MLHYVHSSLIYNSQKLQRTQMSLNVGMDTKNVLFNFLWILCEFHIIYPNSTYLPVPSYPPSVLITSSSKIKEISL